MKKTASRLAVAAVLLSSAALQPLYAQPQPAAPPTPTYGAQAGQIATDLTAVLKSLNLTEAQKTQIKAIADKYRPQVRAIATNKALTTDQKHTQLQALRAAARAEIDAVLTPVQKAKMKALRATLEQELKALVARIGDELNLTSDQKSKIQAIAGDARIQAAAIVSDPALMRRQKAQQLQALRAATRACIRAILDESQRNRLDAITAEIRAEIQKRVSSWRANGGMGMGLML